MTRTVRTYRTYLNSKIEIRETSAGRFSIYYDDEFRGRRQSLADAEKFAQAIGALR